jgi:O-antigen ligase
MARRGKAARGSADGLQVAVLSELDARPPLIRTWAALGRLQRADIPVVALLAWWLTRLTWDGGGRDLHVTSAGAVLAAVAVVVVRPDRCLSRIQLGLATSVALGAWIVVATSPTGWGGANDAASYTVAAATFLAISAWAADDSRRMVVAVAVVVAAGAEFSQAWLPWWGLRDPSAPMFGTFYWKNQFAIFLSPGVILGAWCLTSARLRLLQWVGWVVMPLSAAGIVYSASRAAELAAAVGLLALAAALAVTRRWTELARWAGGVAAAVGITWILTGPPFFSNRAPLAGSTLAESASFVTNGTERFEDWHRALDVFRHWPLSGAGFHSFLAASSTVTTYHDSNVTAFAHNGYLQAFSDGGLILGLPLAVAAILVGGACLRLIARDVRARQVTIATGVGLAALILLLHSGMDYDWSYPALFAEAAILAAWVCSAGRVPPQRESVGRPASPGPVETGARRIAVVLIIAALGAAVAGAWAGELRLNLPISHATTAVQVPG